MNGFETLQDHNQTFNPGQNSQSEWLPYWKFERKVSYRIAVMWIPYDSDPSCTRYFLHLCVNDVGHICGVFLVVHLCFFQVTHIV
jgi:hypothetical protein